MEQHDIQDGSNAVSNATGSYEYCQNIVCTLMSGRSAIVRMGFYFHTTRERQVRREKSGIEVEVSKICSRLRWLSERLGCG